MSEEGSNNDDNGTQRFTAKAIAARMTTFLINPPIACIAPNFNQVGMVRLAVIS